MGKKEIDKLILRLKETNPDVARRIIEEIAFCSLGDDIPLEERRLLIYDKTKGEVKVYLLVSKKKANLVVLAKKTGEP